MNTTTATPGNVTLTTTSTHTTLDELLPEYGQGRTRHALADLAQSLRSLYAELRGWPDEKLAPHLREQRDFLGLLFVLGTEPAASIKATPPTVEYAGRDGSPVTSQFDKAASHRSGT